MALIADASYDQIERFGQELSEKMRASESFEAASQIFVNAFAELFPETALVRLFATLPFARLPEAEQQFATSLAGGVALFPTTDILTLFGTAGRIPAWNDRCSSVGHRAIPLLSREKVNEIPMIARLLSDMDFRLENEERLEGGAFITRAFANTNALFYVPDATTTLDERGRRIIPAEEFVSEHEIRTVFGFGGSYIVQPIIATTIVFARELISKETAMRFLQLSSLFKSATSRFVVRNRYFGDGRRLGRPFAGDA